jgi:putative transposase
LGGVMSKELSLVIGSRWQYDGRLYDCIDIRDEVILLYPLIGSRVLYLSYPKFADALTKKRIFHIDSDAILIASKLAAQVSLLDEKIHEKVQFRQKLCAHIYQKYNGVIPGELKYKDFIDELSRELGLETSPPRSTLNSWYSKYRKGHYSTASLVCESEIKRTRRKNISVETSELIDDVIRESYLTLNKLTIRATYEQFLNRLQFDNSRRDELSKIGSVSYETFRRCVAEISDLEKIEKRDGGFALRRHLKNLKSHDKGNRIGAVTESDSHLIDVVVIDEQSKVVGRPYLFVILDVYTRVVTGWELSFLPPCAAKTIRALRFAIDGERNKFAACPEKLDCDNGSEFRNGSLESAAERLSFVLEWVPPHSPNSKPHAYSGQTGQRFWLKLDTVSG